MKAKFRAVLLLRAKLRGTTYAQELLRASQELKEIEKRRKDSEEKGDDVILTTRDYEIDPNKDLDEQIGIILEGEMRDREKAKSESKDFNKEHVDKLYEALLESQKKIIPPPFCSECVHFNSNEESIKSCKAFPEGIPEIILSGKHDHRTLLPDQKNQIKFSKLYRIDIKPDVID